MLSQPFQKLLVTEKWVWRPRGFEFLEESKLLVSTHRGFQDSHRAIAVQPSITRLWQASDSPPPEVSFRLWMTFLYFVVGAAIQEEVIFRGLLQTTLAQQIPAMLWVFGSSLSYAAIIVALLFGLIHLKINPITAAAAFVLGPFSGNSDTEAVVSCRRYSSMRSLTSLPPFCECLRSLPSGCMSPTRG